MVLETKNDAYTKSSSVVCFQDKTIVVTNHTPVLSPEQRQRRKRQIECTLYDIFKKYIKSSIKRTSKKL